MTNQVASAMLFNGAGSSTWPLFSLERSLRAAVPQSVRHRFSIADFMTPFWQIIVIIKTFMITRFHMEYKLNKQSSRAALYSVEANPVRGTGGEFSLKHMVRII